MAMHANDREKIAEILKLLASALEQGAVKPFRTADGAVGVPLGKGADSLRVLFTRQPNAVTLVLRSGLGPEGGEESFPLYSDGELFPKAMDLYLNLLSGAGSSNKLLDNALELLRSRTSSEAASQPKPSSEAKSTAEGDERKTFFEVLLGGDEGKPVAGPTVVLNEPSREQVTSQEQEHGEFSSNSILRTEAEAKVQAADEGLGDLPDEKAGDVGWPTTEWKELYGRLREMTGP